MRKRKEKTLISETLISEEQQEEVEKEEGEEEDRKGFFACYLLASLSPRHKGQTYIGFTVNPKRRIRQHNGEIGCGAWRTKRKRPWEMVFCIYGFPTHVSALQFEWAWQHPNESLAVRKAAANFKSLSGVANKIKLAYTMLTLPAWHSLNITVNYFSTKYTNHSGGCPSLPGHMKVRVNPMDELPCYSEGNENFIEKEEEVLSYSKMDQNTLMDHSTGIARMASELYGCTATTRSQIGTPEADVDNRDKFTYIADGSRVMLQHQETEEMALELASINPSEVRNSTTGMERNQVDVIDLLTPPPDCRTSSSKRKRRVCAEIIDLTRSPNFVQL